MNVRDLIPWGRNTNSTPASYGSERYGADQSPFLQLHREMNRLFDDAFRGFDSPMSPLGSSMGWNSPWPGVEVSDNGRELQVTAELPGVDEKDVEVVIENGQLILRGEKRAETEDNQRQFSERYYGRFERRLTLGLDIEEDKVSASFKNGVLTILLPKVESAQSKTKRIAINGPSMTH